LRTPLDQAETIKVLHGGAIHTEREREEIVEVPGVGGRAPRKISRNVLVDIIQPRVEEILSLALNEIKKSDYVHLMTSGAVITGGCAMLHGMAELAEEIFNIPVKLGTPNSVKSVTNDVYKPNHATGVGLVLYGFHNKSQVDHLLVESETHLFDKIAERMRRWFGGVGR
jgi:cell division protein FtsA